MYSLSHPTAALTQSDDTVYRFRLNGCALVLTYQCLVLLLPALKLLHVPAVSEWSWYLIMLPVWAPSALLAVVLGLEQVTQLGKAKTYDQAHILVGETSAADY